VDSIRTGRKPAVTGEDGRAAVALIDAVRRSSSTGQAVEVSL
jgi:predicted dehydrogenase